MWLSISVATSFEWGQLTPVLPAVNCVRASMLLRAVTDDWETLALYTIQGMGFLLTPTAFFTCEYPNKTWNVTSVLGSSAVLVLLQSTSVARVSSCLQLNTYSDTLYNCTDLLFLLWKYLTCLTRDSEQVPSTCSASVELNLFPWRAYMQLCLRDEWQAGGQVGGQVGLTILHSLDSANSLWSPCGRSILTI